MRIDRQAGRPLTGHVARAGRRRAVHAHVTIHYFGPEEGLNPAGKPTRRMTAFDCIPIESDGDFTTDPIPPGVYWAELFAAREDNAEAMQSDFTARVDFTVPAEGDLPTLELKAKARSASGRIAAAQSPLKVTDKDGKPFARFQVNVSPGEPVNDFWQTGKDGQASLDQGCNASAASNRSL